ncbi:MAG: hypothetical protein LCH92_08215 [Proteobacteria bacterium]|nr:hypothetical protein [Pseudomonadota bacterium]
MSDYTVGRIIPVGGLGPDPTRSQRSTLQIGQPRPEPTQIGPLFNRDQLDDIRASDREAIAKAARAWAVERCGPAFADELAEYIRKGIAP